MNDGLMGGQVQTPINDSNDLQGGSVMGFKKLLFVIRFEIHHVGNY